MKNFDTQITLNRYMGRKDFVPCPRPNVMINQDTKEIIKTDCKSWKCPVCSKRKSSRLQKKAIRAARFYEMQSFTRFLTLTVPDRSDEVSMMDDLNNLLTQLRKEGYLKAYFWVKEFTPPKHEYIDDKGRKRTSEGERRHLHFVWWGSYIPYQFIQKFWEGRVKPQQVGKSPIRYLIKYLGSDQIQQLFSKNERRYSSSRNFFEVKEKVKVGRWEIVGSWSEGYSDMLYLAEHQAKHTDHLKFPSDPNPDLQLRLNN